MIGAISDERRLIHSLIFKENNNALHFQQFLFGLKEKCRGKRVVIVLDNLQVYQAKLLDGVYDDNFMEMFLPPYSSVLNPFERLWSILKRSWMQDIYHFT